MSDKQKLYGQGAYIYRLIMPDLQKGLLHDHIFNCALNILMEEGSEISMTMVCIHSSLHSENSKIIALCPW